MKNLLAKFYKSLICRVAWALITTATAANAHDLPQHFPHAPTDWGMIQQDCLGYYDRAQPTVHSDVFSKEQLVEIAVVQPDAGNPPEPLAMLSSDRDGSAERIGPALFDGVDCADLESFYRSVPSNESIELTQESIELTQDSIEVTQESVEPTQDSIEVTQEPIEPTQDSIEVTQESIEPTQDSIEVTQESVPEPAATQSETAESEYWEFHKSFYAACSCEFENRQANQSIVPPQFILKRTYIEDHFANELKHLKPLVLRELSASSTEPLAIAIPTQQVHDNQLLSDALSQLVSWDCVARSEFYSSQSAFQFGEFAGSLAKAWFTDTLPLASHTMDDFAHNLTPAQKSISAAPLFVIYTTAAGNELAIPIAQARNWQQPASEAPLIVQAAVSQELQDLVELANLRLKWAGGRLSTAASLMNDWFSDRLARAKSDDLR